MTYYILLTFLILIPTLNQEMLTCKAPRSLASATAVFEG